MQGLTAHSWTTWAAIKSDLTILRPWFEAVARRNDLPLSELTMLGPATHAHARMDQWVLTLYAPASVNVQDLSATREEWEILRSVASWGIPVPELLATGMMDTMPYRITRYIEGQDLSELLPALNPSELYVLGKALAELRSKLYAIPGIEASTERMHEALQSDRWKGLPEAFLRERSVWLQQTEKRAPIVRVHGDLHPGNLRWSAEGILWMLDWGESMGAPRAYDDAQAFWIYRDQPAFLAGLFHAESAADLYEAVMWGVMRHDFGGDMIKESLGMETTLLELKCWVRDHIKEVKDGEAELKGASALP